MTKNFLLFVMISMLTISSSAQTKSTSIKSLLCKKWLLEKYQEADGKTYLASGDEKTEYTQYLKDGTMISIEDGKKISGKWHLDSTTMTMTCTQTQDANYPNKLIVKIFKLTATGMVMQSTDAEGEKLTLYVYPSL